MILFSIIIVNDASHSQMYDNTWILGSKYHNDGDSCQYGIELSFDKSVNIKRIFIERIMEGHNNSFSDINGNLKYYTNGCALFNPGDQIIKNGDSLNLNYDYNAFCTGPGQPPGVPFPNASLFLPLDNGKLMYLSLETFIIPNKYPYVFSPNILSTLIDMESNKVIYKNREVLSGKSTLSRYGLTACKHVDNKSWWVIARNNIDSVFRILHVMSDSISNRIQTIGNKYLNGDLGQSAFSPNGKWFAWYSKTNGLEIMHFDRGNGLFTDYKHITIIDTFEYGFGGIAFSPNSQFLYVCSQGDLFQFDLGSSNIEQSIEHIHHFMGSFCECGLKFPTFFYQMQLGPDCRIYMSSTSSAHCLHVIQYPDRKGKKCQFLEAGFNLPSLNQKSLPEFPNYRIDQPYPCDSTIRFVTSNLDFVNDYFFSEVYPNPGLDLLYIDIELGTFKEARFTLTNISGNVVLNKPIYNHNDHYTFNIHELPQGIYFYTIRSNERMLKNGRFVKLH